MEEETQMIEHNELRDFHLCGHEKKMDKGTDRRVIFVLPLLFPWFFPFMILHVTSCNLRLLFWYSHSPLLRFPGALRRDAQEQQKEKRREKKDTRKRKEGIRKKVFTQIRKKRKRKKIEERQLLDRETPHEFL